MGASRLCVAARAYLAPANLSESERKRFVATCIDGPLSPGTSRAWAVMWGAPGTVPSPFSKWISLFGVLLRPNFKFFISRSFANSFSCGASFQELAGAPRCAKRHPRRAPRRTSAVITPLIP